jgi:hypothetical protein
MDHLVSDELIRLPFYFSPECFDENVGRIIGQQGAKGKELSHLSI